VTSLNDDGSAGTLRSVMAAAGPGDTIVFGVTGTITLACNPYGPLVINREFSGGVRNSRQPYFNGT
jgi:hypothetical protein